MYSAQVLTQDLYPRNDQHVIRELAGGALIMLPSSIQGFRRSRPSAQIVGKTQRSAALGPDDTVKFLKAAWDAVGSEFGSRHTQYKMSYAGAQFVTAGHSFRTYGWGEAGNLVDRLLASFSLEATVSGAKQ